MPVDRIAADSVECEAELRERLARLSLEQKVRLLSGQDHWSTYAEPAVGLRSMVVSDGPVGVRGVRWSEDERSANTASATSLAATFDVDLAREIGRLLGAEARRKGVDVILAPTVNLQRTPYFGRHFETLSEDPLLTSEIAVALVRGMQAEGRATTVKHFIANEAETERMESNSVVDERVLRELYYAPFEAVITQAGGQGLMCSYNRVNGVSASESPLLNDVVKGDWEFDGLVISDWGAVRSVVQSAAAGTDLAMPGPTTAWSGELVEAVRAGVVSEAAVDAKVLRVLRLAGRVGALSGIDPLVKPSALPAPPEPDAPQVRGTLRRAAARGTVLLRNEGRVLPLDPSSLHRLAVIGPAATQPRINGGGSAAVIPPYVCTPLEAIRTALPGVEVVYAEGARPATLVRPLTAEHGSVHPVVERVEIPAPVLRVEFLDSGGSVLGSELRNLPDTLVYGMGYPPGIPAESVAALRITTRITVAADGDYVLAGAGVGHTQIRVNGEKRVDEDLVPVNSDPVIGMSLPPQATVDLHLDAGEPVDVAFDFRPAQRSVVAFRVGFDTAPPDPHSLIADATEAAAGADAAIVLIGTGPEDESEGFDRATLQLGRRPDDLVRAVAAVNSRTVVVVNAGSPVLLPWAVQVAAILVPWFGGQEMATSLARVLVGSDEPGGRLPVTWPALEGPPLSSPRPVDGDVRYDEGLHVGYRGFLRSGVRPAYAFGHGLGYTTWALGSAAAQQTAEGWRVTVPVANTGDRFGRQVVQAYCSRADTTVERPVIWYAGSCVVQCEPGQTETAVLEVSRRRLEHWDTQKGRWALEPGEFTVHIGTASDQLTQSLAVLV